MYTSRKIEDLRPDVAANCKLFLERCKAAGLVVGITCTVRDDEAQLAAYNKGTSKQKKTSFHAKGIGLAFDIHQNIKGQAYPAWSWFEKCGVIGEKMGFEWGGRWKTITDGTHFQWSGHKKEYTSNDIWAGRLPPTMSLFNPAQTPQNAPVSQQGIYKVKKGDTMSKIATVHKISLKELIAANPQIKDPNKISIGQIVNIPQKASVPATQSPVAKPTLKVGGKAKVVNAPLYTNSYGGQAKRRVTGTFIVQKIIAGRAAGVLLSYNYGWVSEKDCIPV